MSSVTAQSPDSSPSPPSPPTSSSPPPSSSQSPPPPPSPQASAPPPKSNNDTSSPSPKSSPSPPADSKSSPPPASSNNDTSSGSTDTPPSSTPPKSGSTTPQLSSPPPPRSSSSNESPPPPSRSQKSPSVPSSTNSSSPSSGSDSSSSGSSSSSSSGVVIGVVVGVVVVLLVAVSVCVICMKKKKKRTQNNMQYYGNQPSQAPKGGNNYYNSPQKNWHNSPGPQGGDHVVRLNPSPGAMNNSGAGWNTQPPPPPPFSNSGEMSSSFSGPRHAPLPPPSPRMSLGGFNKCTFTYDELAAATNGFSQENVLGQGGFGYVHKGILPSGTEVAVKSLKSGSGQGEREFQAEVEIISRVHHRHLVSLEGYCIAGGQRMLVYEFVPNKTLEYHLHSKHLPVMDCPTRLRIATGSAKGLAYLHEDCHPRIIHRDIKSANILIDNNFEAMVADFGLAKLSSDNFTHVSTRVMGTFGYLAPEYASSGKLTEKSDVFSFGIMLLELITGKRPVDPNNTMEDSLVDWARPLLSRALEENNYDQLVDPRLENNYNQHEMLRMIAAAAASIRHSARKRPKMSQLLDEINYTDSKIVRALEGDVSLDEIHEGVKPGQSSFFSSSGSSDYDTMAYNADMKKFRQVALSSQEFGSGEFGSSSNDSREMSANNGTHKV